MTSLRVFCADSDTQTSYVTLQEWSTVMANLHNSKPQKCGSVLLLTSPWRLWMATFVQLTLHGIGEHQLGLMSTKLVFFLRWQYLSQCGSAQTAPSAEKRPQCRMFLSAQLPARSVENFWACQCHLSLAGQLHLRTLIINSGSSGRGKPSQTSHMWRATTTKP